MPTRTRTKPAAVKQAKPATTTAGDKPLAHYLEKEPSLAHQRCAQWIEDQTGYKPDLVTIKLVVPLYQKFQASDFNKAGNAEVRAANEAARAERQRLAEEKRQAAQAKKDAAAARKAEKAAAKTEAATEDKPKPAAKKATKAATPAKAAGTTARPKPRARKATSSAAF